MQTLGLALMWATVASSAFVLIEPAPVDVLAIGLIFLLPLMGLTTVTPQILILACGWLIVGVSSFVAAGFATDGQEAIVHAAVTLYLSLFGILVTAFVLKAPERHTRVLFSAYSVAAVLAAVLGIAGYFELFPGAGELLTKYSRAKATFKDPNVFGPFLITPIVYLVAFFPDQKGWRQAVSATSIALLTVAVLLSFSRAAIAGLVLALALCGYIHFIKARTNRSRLQLSSLAIASVIGTCLVVVVALQFSQIADLARERASFTHAYDVGPEGRFGGQVKALRLLLEHPFGIGAGEFVARHHHEEPHNVFISMFLKAGWIGGLMYFSLILVTTVYGVQRVIKADRSERFLIVIVSSFVAHVAIGFLIDSDHWRHFYLLFGMVWGLALASHARGKAQAAMDTLRSTRRPAYLSRVQQVGVEHTPTPEPPRRRPAMAGMERD